ADLDERRLARACALHPTVRATTAASDVIDAPDVDAVVVATPPVTHFALADRALDAGKHVLVEKPITTSSVHATMLVRKAAVRGRVLLVDHTYVYTGAVRKLLELVQGGVLGEICYYDSVRVNLGLFQSD